VLNATRNHDVDLMRRCIALAKSSLTAGEYPFAAVVAHNGVFLCESINRAKQDRNVNRHAEILAIAAAQELRGQNLSDCTIYSTVEPCAQCSYAIREAQIGRVVYGLKSPLMGGHSRWSILSDTRLSSTLPEVFLPAPEIVSGFLQDEVEAVFQQWGPLIWPVIKARKIFVRTSDTIDARSSPIRSGSAGLARRLRAYLVDLMR